LRSSSIVPPRDSGRSLHRRHARKDPVEQRIRILAGDDGVRRIVLGYAKFVKHGVIGKGLNDYDRIFGTLAKAGYSGWVSIEDGEGPTVEIGLDNLRQSAKFLRDKFVKHFGGGGDE